MVAAPARVSPFLLYRKDLVALKCEGLSYKEKRSASELLVLGFCHGLICRAGSMQNFCFARPGMGRKSEGFYRNFVELGSIRKNCLVRPEELMFCGSHKTVFPHRPAEDCLVHDFRLILEDFGSYNSSFLHRPIQRKV